MDYEKEEIESQFEYLEGLLSAAYIYWREYVPGSTTTLGRSHEQAVSKLHQVIEEANSTIRLIRRKTADASKYV